MSRKELTCRAGVALVASCLLVGPALARADSGVKVTHAWAKSTAPGQNVAAAYLDVVSNAPAALVKAESPVAKVVELHEMRMERDVMKMRAVPKIELPAGKEVKLEPGGLHVMLIDIKQPLKVGEKVPLTLVIDVGGKSERLSVEAEVMDAKAGGHRH